MAKSAQQIIRESVRRVLSTRKGAASPAQSTINENWMKIAGLLNEAADRPAAEAAVKKYLAGGQKDSKAAEQALATALAAAGFDELEEIEELLSRHMEGSEALARDLVKLLPKKK